MGPKIFQCLFLISEQLGLACIFHAEFAQLSNDFRRAAGLYHLAPVQERHTLTKLLGFLQVMGGQQEAYSLLVQLPQQIPHLVPENGVQSNRWLVQQDNLRLWKQRTAEHDLPLHATGQMANLLLTVFIESCEFHQLGCSFFPFLFRNVIESALVFQNLFDTHVISQGIFLGHDRNFLLQLHIVAGQFHAVCQDSTGSGQHQRGQNADHGGLAGTVGTKQTEELTVLDGQIHMIKGHLLPKFLCNCLGLKLHRYPS